MKYKRKKRHGMRISAGSAGSLATSGGGGGDVVCLIDSCVPTEAHHSAVARSFVHAQLFSPSNQLGFTAQEAEEEQLTDRHRMVADGWATISLFYNYSVPQQLHS
jgi:hypothetical protein